MFRTLWKGRLHAASRRLTSTGGKRAYGASRRLASAGGKQTYSSVEGRGSSAVLFGGFAFGPRQMRKHAALYEAHGFEVHQVLSPGIQGIKDLTTPRTSEQRGRALAEEVQAQGDRPICLHAISGSVWTMIYMLEALPKEWRDRYVRAIFFDSCPPMSDTLAFGGFVEFFFKRKGLRELSAPLFQPYRALCGIDAEWEAANHRRMFGESAVIPRGAHCLFMHGRNDPVLNNEYIQSFIRDIRQHREPGVEVNEATFEKTRHSLAIIEEPEVSSRRVAGVFWRLPEFGFCFGIALENVCWFSIVEWALVAPALFSPPPSCPPHPLTHRSYPVSPTQPYKLVHISSLLRKVPEWRLGGSVAEPGQAPRISLKDYEGRLVLNSA